METSILIKKDLNDETATRSQGHTDLQRRISLRECLQSDQVAQRHVSPSGIREGKKKGLFPKVLQISLQFYKKCICL